MPCFFGAKALIELAATMSGGMGLRKGSDRRRIDLYDELTCDGEKPLTTFVILFFGAGRF